MPDSGIYSSPNIFQVAETVLAESKIQLVSKYEADEVKVKAELLILSKDEPTGTVQLILKPLLSEKQEIKPEGSENFAIKPISSEGDIKKVFKITVLNETLYK